MNENLATNGQVFSSDDLCNAIRTTDFSNTAVTIVGYGFMGKRYLEALTSLGVGDIHVCSRSNQPLEALKGLEGISTTTGGFQKLARPASANDLGIVATPTADLLAAAAHLANLGFRKILVEKPVSLWSHEIMTLATLFERLDIHGVTAYNRLAYPSYLEARARTLWDGGITSCIYTFTEMIQDDWPVRYTSNELTRWGVANSLHPISMAHGLIGFPKTWNAQRFGAISWHPSGSVFVGAGVSELSVPFTYQADWTSKGRWSVEVNTQVASYRLCPLEKLFTKTAALGNWEEVPITTFDHRVKTGIAEQVSAMISDDIRPMVPLLSIKQAAHITSYAENVFGYQSS